MPRLDYTATEHQVSDSRLLRAALRVLIKEINALRALVPPPFSLPPLTAEQVKEKLRQELNNLP